MPRVLAALLHLLARAVAGLPWPWLRALADAIAARELRRGSREARIAARNLELAYPEMPAGERAPLQRSILRTTARQALETLRFWTRPPARNLARVVRTAWRGTTSTTRSPPAAGLIVAAPHFGNWELLNQWLASRTPLAILYAPPESAVGDAFLQPRPRRAGRSRPRHPGPGRRPRARASCSSGCRAAAWWASCPTSSPSRATASSRRSSAAPR